VQSVVIQPEDNGEGCPANKQTNKNIYGWQSLQPSSAVSSV